eukprot:355801_1
MVQSNSQMVWVGNPSEGEEWATKNLIGPNGIPPPSVNTCAPQDWVAIQHIHDSLFFKGKSSLQQQFPLPSPSLESSLHISISISSAYYSNTMVLHFRTSLPPPLSLDQLYYVSNRYLNTDVIQDSEKVCWWLSPYVVSFCSCIVNAAALGNLPCGGSYREEAR